MKIDDKTRAELALLTYSGNTAVIANQLDRKAYKLVNDVLVACGGKWNRARKAHVFDGDAAEAMDAAIATGVVLTASDMQFFPTNPFEAERLVQWVIGDASGPDLVILEPSAGNGAIARFAARRGPTTAIEVDKRHLRALEAISDDAPHALQLVFTDFMTANLDAHFTHVVGNPPFAKTFGHDAIDHFRRAHSLLKPGGVMGMIMPESIEWREDRRHSDFRSWLGDLDTTMEPMPDDAFAHAGTRVKTVRVKTRGV